MDKLQTQDQSAIYRATDRLESISLVTGELAWQVDIGRSGLMGLIEADDSLYLLTESALRQYTKDGNEGWKVEDRFGKYKGMGNELPTFFAQDDRVFVIGPYQDRVAYDASTGKEIWKNDSGMESR